MGSSFKRSKITSTLVDGLAPGAIVMDRDEPAFGVRRQGEARVFFVRKFAHGRRHFQTIGEYGTGGLTVTAARDKAKRLVVAIRDGLSPAERRAVDRTMPTLTELAADWLAVHVDVKLKQSTARLYRSTLKSTILPSLGSIRVAQLSDDHIARMHHAARATPYAANRALAIISKLMNYAERKRLRPRGTNPVTGIDKYRERKRERFLSHSELHRLGAALAGPEVVMRHSLYARAAIAFLVMTGMRLGEVLKLTWQNVDYERGMLLLDDSKSGARPVILGEPAIRLLAALPRLDGPWVFPGERAGRPLYDLKKTWRTVTAVARLDNVRLHDLRHTFASVSAGKGGSLPMIGRLLGHSQPATTARYTHLVGDPVRELADRSAAAVADALGPIVLSAEATALSVKP